MFGACIMKANTIILKTKPFILNVLEIFSKPSPTTFVFIDEYGQ